MADLTPLQLVLLVIGALGVGFSKSGFAGVGMIHVVLFAFVFGARASSGVLLPLLIVGDLCAVRLIGQQVQWRHVRRLLPPTVIGVIIGWAMMGQLNEAIFKPLVGYIILSLVAVQLVRLWRPSLFERIPHARWFAWSLGLMAGITTMLANAAGPVIALYLLAIALPKYELISTGAWFFLIINIFKVPFSAGLGLIDSHTLLLNLMLAPAVVSGLFIGRWLVRRLPQKIFDSVLLGCTALAAMRLILSN